MHVVTAAVHGLRNDAGIGQAGLFFQRRSASSSVRIITVGPGPFSNSATRPVPPTFSVTGEANTPHFLSEPRGRAVVSWNPISGCWCRSLVEREQRRMNSRSPARLARCSASAGVNPPLQPGRERKPSGRGGSLRTGSWYAIVPQFAGGG